MRTAHLVELVSARGQRASDRLGCAGAVLHRPPHYRHPQHLQDRHHVISTLPVFQHRLRLFLGRLHRHAGPYEGGPEVVRVVGASSHCKKPGTPRLQEHQSRRRNATRVGPMLHLHCARCLRRHIAQPTGSQTTLEEVRMKNHLTHIHVMSCMGSLGWCMQK